jgi:hypothetical protein
MENVEVISLDIFLHIRQLCTIARENIHLKAEFLRKTFHCFIESNESKTIPFYNSKWTNKNNVHALKQTIAYRDKSKKPDKLRINNRDISKESQTRRDFMAFVNRLSDANLKLINTYFKTKFQFEFLDVYISILWDMMLRSTEFQHLYVECFVAIHDNIPNENTDLFTTKIEELWNNYNDKQIWIPSEELINEKDYDDFCDFVKWKKNSISYIHSFAKFVNKNWLPKDVYTTLGNNFIIATKDFMEKYPIGCKGSDALLDQLLILVEYTMKEYDISLSIFIKDLRDNGQIYRPSTRFKVYDVDEFLERKLKFFIKNKTSKYIET